jgi:hypothetical protein
MLTSQTRDILSTPQYESFFMALHSRVRSFSFAKTGTAGMGAYGILEAAGAVLGRKALAKRISAANIRKPGKGKGKGKGKNAGASRRRRPRRRAKDSVATDDAFAIAGS